MKKLEKNVLMKDLGNRKIRMKNKKMPNQSFEQTEKAPPLNSDVIYWMQTMNYFEHFRLNIDVVISCIHAAIWHFAHAVVPCRFTSHDYWKINFNR